MLGGTAVHEGGRLKDIQSGQLITCVLSTYWGFLSCSHFSPQYLGVCVLRAAG